MAGKGVKVARVTAGLVPDIRALTCAASPSATLIIGALVVADGTTGLIDTCGANPTLIAGVALQAASSAAGYSAANSPAPITGAVNNVSVAIANQVTLFQAPLTNGSSTIIAPAASDIGKAYGVTAYSSYWTVDKNKTTTTARVTVEAIDTDNNVVIFKFLTANCQFSA